MRYKVLTERDSLVLGKFEPEDLERMLNELGVEGWRVKAAVHTQNAWKRFNTSLLVILENDE